jgi:hypothetical protein
MRNRRYQKQGKIIQQNLLSWLGTGSQNAKKTVELLEQSGLITRREAIAYSKVDSLGRWLRDAAEKNRKDGRVISSTNGYFIAANALEIDKFVKTMEASAVARLKKATTLRPTDPV